MFDVGAPLGDTVHDERGWGEEDEPAPVGGGYEEEDGSHWGGSYYEEHALGAPLWESLRSPREKFRPKRDKLRRLHKRLTVREVQRSKAITARFSRNVARLSRMATQRYLDDVEERRAEGVSTRVAERRVEQLKRRKMLRRYAEQRREMRKEAAARQRAETADALASTMLRTQSALQLRVSTTKSMLLRPSSAASSVLPSSRSARYPLTRAATASSTFAADEDDGRRQRLPSTQKKAKRRRKVGNRKAKQSQRKRKRKDKRKRRRPPKLAPLTDSTLSSTTADADVVGVDELSGWDRPTARLHGLYMTPPPSPSPATRVMKRSGDGVADGSDLRRRRPPFGSAAAAHTERRLPW
eukprot:PLAT13278.1.p1 GENE.PLAT13278.1~~PLAT13278.1.p1  ORF type:complete len:354 (+),score=79.78 PLAT13278.1:89-1150(+)